MSLSTTLNIAQSSLANNAALSTIVSRNIAGVNDPNYAVKTGEVETAPYGGVKLVGIRNATDDALFANLLSAKSDAASSSALSSGLDQLGQTLGLDSTTAANGTATDRSPATLIGQFTDALQQYAASPADASLGQAAVAAAKTLASSLNTAAVAVQSVRAQADAGLQTSVSTINSLLKQFGDANTAVTNATVTGSDATDALDARNKILSSLSAEIGITTAPAGNGALALGQYASPDDCWLALRGVRTMGVRLERQMRSGIEVAEWFAAQPEVQAVLHPALPGAPGHALWKRDFTGACSLFGVVFKPNITVEATHRMIDALELFGIGASWGGFESLVLPTTGSLTRTADSGVFPGPVCRFHIGLEDPADLIADLQEGFASM